MNPRSALAGIFAAAAATIGVSAGPAAASPAVYNCQANQVCFYKNGNFTGTQFHTGNNASFWGLQFNTFADGTNANDQISSIINNTDRCVFGYYDEGWAGKYVISMGPNSRADLSNASPQAGQLRSGPPVGVLNDQISSIGVGQGTQNGVCPGNGNDRPGYEQFVLFDN